METEELPLGPFIHPTTYHVIAAARSWFDDLLVVVIGMAVITLLELLFNQVRISMFVRDGTDSIDHLILVLQAQIWYPAVAAGVVMLACLRLCAHLGHSPSTRRVLAFSLIGVASFGFVVLELNDGDVGFWPVRFGPLIAAAGGLFVVSRVRRRRPLRAPTIAGLRPSRRALLTPKGRLALANLRTAIPPGGMITTDAVDAALEAFSCRQDDVSEAYAYARSIEHDLARGRIVAAEAKLERACRSDRLREQPALICAEAMVLQATGRHDDAVEVLERAKQLLGGRSPLALRSLLAHARLLAGCNTPADDRIDRDWARLVYAGRPGTVLLELVARIDAAAETQSEAALRAAHRVLVVVNAVQCNPLVELKLDELERVEDARGRASMTIATICERGRAWQEAADAYLDAVPAFMFIKDRTRMAECFVRSSALLLANGQGSAGQESHALDLMRVGFELVEAERGGLRTGRSRAAWVRDRQSLYGVAFHALAKDLRWHADKGAELAFWLMESLHRTTLAAAARTRLASTDAELHARLEELARAEAGQVNATAVASLDVLSRLRGEVAEEVDERAVSIAREAVVAQFARARDGALAVDQVDVETLRAKLGAALSLLYHCSREGRGWVITCVVAHPKGELIFRGLVEAGEDAPSCALLDAIAEKRLDAVRLAFATPMWDSLWGGLAAGVLSPQLATLLQGVGDDAPELVVVPDGPLAAVPFAGLKLADGRTLLEAARVRMIPSLSLVEDELDPVLPCHASVLITHSDEGIRHGDADVMIPLTVCERATGTRAELEHALRAEPPADLAVILAHGHAGNTPYDDAVLLSDSAMSAAAAMQLPWPPAVVLGSCWLGGSDVAVGNDSFGFPVACLMSGAKTIVGALSPVPRSEVTDLLAHITTELPTAANLGEIVRRAIISEEGASEPWDEVPAMEWPCLTTWSTVCTAKATLANARATSWDRQGLPRQEVVTDDRSVDVRMSLPLSAAALAIVEHEQGHSRRGVLGLSGLLEGICSADSVCSKLPGAAEMRAAAAIAPLDTEVPDRILRPVDRSSPIYLSAGAATALEVSEAIARDLDLADIPPSLVALAVTFDERTSTRVNAQPRAKQFIDALMDLLERNYEIDSLMKGRPSYDSDLAARMRDQSKGPASDTLRYVRRMGWGAAFLALGVLGGGLSDASRLQSQASRHGFLGVKLGAAPDGFPEVVDVVAHTPAARAGIHVGDEIEAIDGLRTVTVPQALYLIGRHRPGQMLRLVARRNSGQLSLTARLTTWP